MGGAGHGGCRLLSYYCPCDPHTSSLSNTLTHSLALAPPALPHLSPLPLASRPSCPPPLQHLDEVKLIGLFYSTEQQLTEAQVGWGAGGGAVGG